MLKADTLIDGLDLETSPLTSAFTVVPSEPMDYTEQLESLNFIGITLVFAIGILSGLLLGKTLWDKVKL